MPKAKRPSARQRKLASRFAEIASKHLGVETLEIRGLDRLDFHDVGVAGIARALQAAYDLGVSDGLQRALAALDGRNG